MEAQFPLNVALASLAISRGGYFEPFDNTWGVEGELNGAPEKVLISTWGHWRGESLALIGRPDAPLREKD
jgi:3-oxoacyl-[acyl-carrier-protein] synthase II